MSDSSYAPSQAKTVQTAERPRRARRELPFKNELGILIALMLMMAVIGISHPGFLSSRSLTSIANAASYYGILAVGMVFLLSMREIDLSVGSSFGLCIAGAAVLMRDGMEPWLGALMGIVIGLGLGAVNGLLANFLRIPSIIVTLGTLSMYQGLTLIVSGGRTVSGIPIDHPFFDIVGGKLLGIPMAVVGFVLITAILSVVYRATRYGFIVRAIGSNEQAARLSGISIPRIRLLTLTLMGGLCGVAGMLTLAFFTSADPSLGRGYELLAIAAAIIGGTGLSGGSGTVPGALLGALTIGVIQSGLIQFGVEANWSIFATGALIIAAVWLDTTIRRGGFTRFARRRGVAGSIPHQTTEGER